MTKHDDGGPAYPHLGLYGGADGNLHPTPTQFLGISMRDWFAGKALAGILTNAEMSDEKIARASYDLADAMLAERSKRHE